MRFIKFQADGLFTGSRMLPSNFVVICNEHGKIEDIAQEQDAGEDIQRLQGVLTPGFVNCHCHLELSHMRHLIPEKTGLIDFVFTVVTQRNMPEEKILLAIAEGENEMIRSGIVAVGDVCNGSHTLTQKQKRRMHYYNLVEATGWLPLDAENRFQKSYTHYTQFAEMPPASIVPHAPYSVSQALWQMIKPYYRNKVASIHNQETHFEDELFLLKSGDFVKMYEMMKLDNSFFQASGKSSLQTYLPHFSGAAHVILVHNTFTKEEDIAWLKTERLANTVSFCLCANANLYIEGALPPVEMLKRNKCHIVLGTDSLASNWSLSIFDEIKTIGSNFRDVSIEELLTWATQNGAKALQMEDILGSFERGKIPGVVLLQNLVPNDKTSLKVSIPVRLL